MNTLIHWATTAPAWQKAASGVGALVLLVAVWKAAGALVRKTARWDFADVITVLIALAATIYAGSGNWKFLAKAMGYGVDLRAVLVCVFEGAVVVEGLRSRRNIERHGTTGRDGTGLWVLTCVSGLLSVSESDTVQEALGRLVVPLVAAWLWERLLSAKVDEAAAKLAAERAAAAVPSRIRWRIRPERIAVWLRLADATDTSLAALETNRKVVRFLRATDRENREHTLRWPLSATSRADRARTRLAAHALLHHGDPTAVHAALATRMLGEALVRLGVAPEGASQAHPQDAVSADQGRTSGRTRRASGKRSGGGSKRGSRGAPKRLDDVQLAAEAERLNAESWAADSRPVSLRTLQRELHIGQPRATALLEALTTASERVLDGASEMRIPLTLGDPIRRPLAAVNGTKEGSK